MCLELNKTNPPSHSIKNSLITFHQNIRGLMNKIDELNCSMMTRHINPHLLCLSEHYMTNSKLTHCNLQNFILGTSYARTNYQGGGVCIYIKPDIKLTATDLTQYCDDKNLEIC
jgi:hypothetical protein